MNTAKNLSTDRAFAMISLVSVVAAVIAGFWLLGSPSQQRLIALDGDRIRDLQAIAREIQDFPGEDSVPPESLPAPRNGFNDFRDPVTDEPYEYRRLSETHYELCATFATDSQAQRRPPLAQNDRWQHPAGRHCFEIPVQTAQPIPQPSGE